MSYKLFFKIISWPYKTVISLPHWKLKNTGPDSSFLQRTGIYFQNFAKIISAYSWIVLFIGFLYGISYVLSFYNSRLWFLLPGTVVYIALVVIAWKVSTGLFIKILCVLLPPLAIALHYTKQFRLVTSSLFIIPVFLVGAVLLESLLIGLPLCILYVNSVFTDVSGSGSMYPTISGESILVSISPLRINSVNRFDIVGINCNENNNAACENWKEDGSTYLKRAIGLPGETVEIKKGKVFINGAPLTEPLPITETHAEDEKYATITLKNDEIYVLGDNRYYSADSRYNGPVPLSAIDGVYTTFNWFRTPAPLGLSKDSFYRDFNNLPVPEQYFEYLADMTAYDLNFLDPVPVTLRADYDVFNENLQLTDISVQSTPDPFLLGVSSINVSWAKLFYYGFTKIDINEYYRSSPELGYGEKYTEEYMSEKDLSDEDLWLDRTTIKEWRISSLDIAQKALDEIKTEIDREYLEKNPINYITQILRKNSDKNLIWEILFFDEYGEIISNTTYSASTGQKLTTENFSPVEPLIFY